jgi:hypothetical protein
LMVICDRFYLGGWSGSAFSGSHPQV